MELEQGLAIGNRSQSRADPKHFITIEAAYNKVKSYITQQARDVKIILDYPSSRTEAPRRQTGPVMYLFNYGHHGHGIFYDFKLKHFYLFDGSNDSIKHRYVFESLLSKWFNNKRMFPCLYETQTKMGYCASALFTAVVQILRDYNHGMLYQTGVHNISPSPHQDVPGKVPFPSELS